VAIGCILAATLTPARGASGTGFFNCVLCGDRWIADALVNVILFAPLGATLAVNGRTGLRAVVAAGILSCCVELAQVAIPGRDPSLGDVCFNTLGAAAGQGVPLLAKRWLNPGTRPAASLSLAAASLAAVVFGLTGVLLAPTFPAGPYYSRWTADRADRVWYAGRVLDARLGTLSLRPSGNPMPAEVQTLLISGASLRIDAVAGPRPSSLGPLVTIEDRRQREVLLVGPDRDDLVLTYRARSAQLGLAQPDVRLRAALTHVKPRDTLHIAIQRNADGYCLGVNQLSGCDLWFTVGSGWALLMYPSHWPHWAQQLLDSGWIAGLLLPVGLWMRRRPESFLAAALVVMSLAMLPHAAGLNATAPREWVGAGCGLLLGFGLRALTQRRTTM
jgi:hypothetical protein